MRHLRIIAAVAALVVAFDQLTKHWALNALGDGDVVHVIWTLRFNLSFNSGMAFSTGTDAGPFIGLAAILVSIVLVVWQLRTMREGQSGRGSLIITGLIVGGAWGNIVDRLFREEKWLHGRVVDFIDFQWWPIFNIADAAVTVGVLLMVANSFRSGLKEESDV